MGQQYLIDTNSVIDYLGNKIPASGMLFMNTIVDAIPNISIVTKIEVLGFIAPNEHHKILQAFINDAVVLNLDDEVADKTINLRKESKIKLPDAIIAATALVKDLTLITEMLQTLKM
ncbi:MAG TPA: type II toxin-antitoxin system VapC family toxin [Segetibacter sp.]